MWVEERGNGMAMARWKVRSSRYREENFMNHVLCSSIMLVEVIISIVTLKMDDRNWYVKMALQFWATRNVGHSCHGSNMLLATAWVSPLRRCDVGHLLEWSSYPVVLMRMLVRRGISGWIYVVRFPSIYYISIYGSWQKTPTKRSLLKIYPPTPPDIFEY